MPEEPLESRLSRIATRWSLLEEAHGSNLDAARMAQAKLLGRYHGAVYRYLLAILRNPDVADEVFQEFALRFLRGDFQGAHPERGRFRSYLKTALVRMGIDHRRKRARRGDRAHDQLDQVAGEHDDVTPEDEGEFEASWRAELLQRTWTTLEEEDGVHDRGFYLALKRRSEAPETSARELARFLTEARPERPVNEVHARQILRRARDRFAELLIDEVARSIETRELDEIEAELASLQLLPYCRATLRRKRGGDA